MRGEGQCFYSHHHHNQAWDGFLSSSMFYGGKLLLASDTGVVLGSSSCGDQTRFLLQFNTIIKVIYQPYQSEHTWNAGGSTFTSLFWSSYIIHGKDYIVKDMTLNLNKKLHPYCIIFSSWYELYRSIWCMSCIICWMCPVFITRCKYRSQY